MASRRDRFVYHLRCGLGRRALGTAWPGCGFWPGYCRKGCRVVRSRTSSSGGRGPALRGRLACRPPGAQSRRGCESSGSISTLEGQSGSVVVTGGTVTVIIQTGIPDDHPRDDRDKTDRRVGRGKCHGCARSDEGGPLMKASAASASETPRKRTAVAVAVSSATALTLLICGIPVLLVAIHAVPPLSAIRRGILEPGSLVHLFAGQMDDDAVLHAIWLVAWAAWLWLTLCVAAEIVARVCGRSTRRLPGSRRVQSTMTFLVGASLALGPIGRQAVPLRLQVAGVFEPQCPCSEPRGISFRRRRGGAEGIGAIDPIERRRTGVQRGPDGTATGSPGRTKLRRRIGRHAVVDCGA